MSATIEIPKEEMKVAKLKVNDVVMFKECYSYGNRPSKVLKNSTESKLLVLKEMSEYSSPRLVEYKSLINKDNSWIYLGKYRSVWKRIYTLNFKSWE